MNKLKNIFVILLIGVLGLISSCDEPDPNPEHVHKFSNEWEYHDFSHYYRCECGTITSDEPHSFGEWVVVDEPTESAVGSKKHICDVCGYEGYEEIPTLQHTHEFYEEITEPTCTEEGCINYVCACGYFSDSQSIPATGHKEEVIEGYESTCSSFGLANGVKCSECDESLVDQVLIQSLPHDFIDGVCSICNVSEYCEGLEYKVLEDGTLGVSGIGTCTDENIIIPSFHLGYPVTTICTNAFYEIDSVKSMVVPDTIIKIEYGAFYCCSLEKLTIPFIGETKDGTENTHFSYIYGFDLYPDSPGDYGLKELIITGGTKISDYAFFNCYGINTIEFPNEVNYIGDGAFKGCQNLRSVVIPDGVEFIGEGTFNNCYKLSEIVIPNGVTHIKDYAFSGCHDLVSISIPSSVTSIGEFAFSNCVKLVEVYNFSNIDFYAEDNLINQLNKYAKVIHTTLENSRIIKTDDDFVFFHDLDDQYYLLGYYGSNIEIALPDNINEEQYHIYDYAFYKDSDLDKITLSSGSISIGVMAFAETDIENIVIPKEVKTIGDGAFERTLFLESVIIEDGVENIGAFAFSDSRLLSIVIPKSINIIGNNAFDGCYRLESVILPEGVEYIGEQAFSGCNSLTYVSISSTVETIEKYAFADCYNLTWLIMFDGLLEIKEYAFSGCENIKNIYHIDGLKFSENRVIPEGNNCLYEATLYKYSETEPTEDGNYWYYDVDGITPIIW